MSHTDSASPINTIIIKIILHTYLMNKTRKTKITLKRPRIIRIKRIFMSSYTCYQDLLYGEVTEDAFAFGYDYLVKGADAFE